MQTLYCTKCNDSKLNPCTNCISDPYVIILHKDAQELYKLTNYDLLYSIQNECHFKAGNQLRGKYFVDEIEKIAIDKFEKMSDNESNKILNDVLKLKNIRTIYKTRYIAIRTELIELIKKAYDIDYEFSQEILVDMSDAAKLSEDIWTCVNNIFVKHNNEINQKYLIDKRKKFVNATLLDAFGENLQNNIINQGMNTLST